ncbi:MG2 domain-containing protein [Flavobacterium sp. I-STPA6A]|uniref:alpha-2-macroglobulin family protein n=1 Tax=Flavobacterium sp. I-STPA6A TaxID=2590450 RepID=UPI00131D76FA|nr:MG2 domain-containing protein [Flavobacterium sp. I-STPA6A]
MKKYILTLFFVTVTAFSQQYEKKWSQILAQENKGKIKSATELVDAIYKKAKKENNEVQIIKCFFYKSKYLQVLEEDAQNKIIRNLKTEINSATIPSKAILNLVYAKCLIAYKNKNSYLIYNRTNTTSLEDDFLTWTAKDFEKEISSSVTKTLTDETVLKKTPLTQYEAVFDFSKNQDTNESLYSYLVGENIDYLKTNLNYWQSRNNKQLQAMKEELFQDSENFAKLKFDFLEKEPIKLVLQLYQELEKEHSTSEKQLTRMKFIQAYVNISHELYLKFLNQIKAKSTDTISNEKIQLENASILLANASKKTFPDYNKKALALLDSIIKNNSRTNAFKQAVQLSHTTTLKTLTVQLQKHSYTNENTRASVQYKNVNKLKVTFYKIDQKTNQILQNATYNKDSLVQTIRAKKEIATRDYDLENKKDYYEYTTEILLPQLETGTYLVYLESDSFDANEKAFAFKTLTVTNIAVLATHKNNMQWYQVLDRKTGKPLENVSVKSPRETLTTNKKGIAIAPKEKENDNDEIIEFSLKNDTLSLEKQYVYNTYDYEIKDDAPEAMVEFFMDRAIYRPGQTVYYKGIAFQKNNNNSQVVSKTSFHIRLKNANYETFKEFDVTTNEFGSFSGEFNIPKTGLTGEFRIEAEEPDDYEKDVIYDTIKDEHPFWDVVEFNHSVNTFKVEEYKRPKFEVTFEPFTKTYQVNQNILATGQAKAFSGSSISDAIVKYEVKLQTFSSRNSYYNDYTNEISSILIGETKTDASGKFEINFIANPSNNISKEELPLFKYLIHATVTDINGETHTTQTEVIVGYHTLKLTASVQPSIKTNDKNQITLNSTNLNNAFIPTQGEIKLYYVSPFATKFKPRIFSQPEIVSIPDEEFERLFPYELNEKQNAVKPAETLVFSTKVNTEKDKKLLLDFISDYKSGNYRVVFSAIDIFNNPIETSSNFQIIQSKDKFDSSKLFTAKQLNEDPKKDGFVLVKLSSTIPDLYINTTGNYHGDIYFEDVFHLENNETIIKIPLKNEFENEICIGFESVFENNTSQDRLEIYLQKVEPSLNFSVESFRNKIQPGSNENWSFQLKSSNTLQEAEILASMYDSSLDQFTKKNWSDLKINDYYSNSLRFKNSLGFDKEYITLLNLNPFLNRITFDIENTNLMWFGFDFNDSFTSKNIDEYRKQINNKSKKPLNAKMISGYVFDKDEPLPGVVIQIDGTNRGTQSDFDGYYQIEAAQGEELNFSYIGFEVKKITVTTKVIDVQLEESSSSLQEVVITGYGSQKRKASTGVAAVVEEAPDNAIYATAGIDKQLAGTVKGLQVSGAANKIIIRGANSTSASIDALCIVDGVTMTMEQIKAIAPNDIIDIEVLKADKAIALYGEKGKNGVIIITTKKVLEALTQVKARKNLSETAFFYPHLKTDDKGKLSFSFSAPEALTSWKLRLLAHNKAAVSGYLEKMIVTQKELMITPNFPRFFRERDSIVITAKIANITNETKKGLAVLQLFDATTMQAVDVKMANNNTVKNFTIAAFGNTSVNWKIYIPEGLQGVQYKIVAKAGDFSDGEENIVPVLTNNMLVAESIPVWVRDNSKKEYSLENLKNNTSTTLKNHQFTFEYTSNPTWLAIQSLPYLMEYEHECAEQTFARFYSNALASEIISSNPKIESLFKTWSENKKINSKLEKNEELKSIILAETPWINDAKSDAEKKKNLALLFDLEKMKNAQEIAFSKLKQKQKPSGGFGWFDGGTESEYITRHILAGLGHLTKLSTTTNSTEKIAQIAKTGIPYLDQKFLEQHKNRITASTPSEKIIWHNPYSELHYLYTRSFYVEQQPLSDTIKKATKWYIETAKKDWLSYSLYEKGLAAITLNRFGEKDTAKKIIESLKETASNNEDWGMYWIANKAGWYWHQAPIETQALLIEAFAEVTNDKKAVDEMKVWLLKNKQVKHWPTTKATTEAVYALLMQGTDWLSVKDNTVIKIGDEKILTKKLSENVKEAETGYVKLNWKSDEIKKEMGTISIQNKSNVPGFGGIYWQYFEELDQIKNNSGGILSVAKELFIKKNTANGDVLQKINAAIPLQIGDLVTVRLIITAKEDMEFVHLKDLRASCFEPVNVLSEYQYKGGLGFYNSTKDAATHFFFDSINKGTYVLEYDIRVNNAGVFSNGITTIQSMYAPEFSSHTKGIRIKVKK